MANEEGAQVAAIAPSDLMREYAPGNEESLVHPNEKGCCVVEANEAGFAGRVRGIAREWANSHSGAGRPEEGVQNSGE